MSENTMQMLNVYAPSIQECFDQLYLWDWRELRVVSESLVGDRIRPVCQLSALKKIAALINNTIVTL